MSLFTHNLEENSHSLFQKVVMITKNKLDVAHLGLPIRDHISYLSFALHPNNSLHLPANYSFNLGVFLQLLLPQPPLTVLESVLVLQEDLIGLLLLCEKPPLVLLQLFVGHHEALLQGVDFLLILSYLRKRYRRQNTELKTLLLVTSYLPALITLYTDTSRILP